MHPSETVVDEGSYVTKFLLRDIGVLVSRSPSTVRGMGSIPIQKLYVDLDGERLYYASQV